MSLKIDRNRISQILQYRHYLIGGSYVTNPDSANDIDIVVNQFVYDGIGKDRLAYYGFHPLQSGDEKYDEIDNKRLIEVFEGHLDGVKHNIIVVGAVYWPAYVTAISRMERFPSLYQKREDRVALHKQLCQQIHDMLPDDFD